MLARLSFCVLLKVSVINCCNSQGALDTTGNPASNNTTNASEDHLSATSNNVKNTTVTESLAEQTFNISDAMVYKTYKNAMNKDFWNGWEPPPEAGGGSFQNFLEEYNKQTEEYKKKSWTGQIGMPPPQWAYSPANVGLPSYCTQPPTLGNCSGVDEQTRYGYNPYLDECVAFKYCSQGNQNNFRTLEKCELACVGSTEGGCDPDSRIPVDSLAGL